MRHTEFTSLTDEEFVRWGLTQKSPSPFELEATDRMGRMLGEVDELTAENASLRIVEKDRHADGEECRPADKERRVSDELRRAEQNRTIAERDQARAEVERLKEQMQIEREESRAEIEQLKDQLRTVMEQMGAEIARLRAEIEKMRSGNGGGTPQGGAA